MRPDPVGLEAHSVQWSNRSVASEKCPFSEARGEQTVTQVFVPAGTGVAAGGNIWLSGRVRSQGYVQHLVNGACIGHEATALSVKLW